MVLMVTLIIYIIIIVFLVRFTKKKRAGKESQPKKVMPRKQKASARPNQQRKTKKTAQEKQYSEKTRVSSENCSYEAAYSKGQPARLGLRGDYGEEVRSGQICVRCGYCGAENLVPAGSREHYHCYFCWEKL